MVRNLKNIFEALVKIDNIMVWDGKKKPFYENYDVVFSHPNAKFGCVLQYELIATSSKHHGKKAYVTGVFINGTDNKIVCHEVFDLNKYDILHNDHFISIQNSFLSLAQSSGLTKTNKHSLKWELSFEDPVLSLRLTPINSFYHHLFTKTKFIQPRFLSYLCGDLFVDEKKFEIKKTKVRQTHTYGNLSCKNYSLCSSNFFKEDSEAYFQALTRKTSFFNRKIFNITYCQIFMDGKKFYITSLFKALFSIKSQRDSKTWNLEFTCKGYRFICKIVRDTKKTAGIKKLASDGSFVFWHCCPLANIEIKAYKKQGADWHYHKTLSTKNNACFETLTTTKEQGLFLDIE